MKDLMSSFEIQNLSRKTTISFYIFAAVCTNYPHLLLLFSLTVKDGNRIQRGYRIDCQR
jgi:hypothetical protein